MADKSIKFEAAIDPKVSPKMERMLKQYGKLTQDAFAAKDIKKYNREFDETLKKMERHIKLSKTQAETLRNGPIKAMKEQEQVFERIVRRAERAQHILDDTGYASRWLERKMRSEGITEASDPEAYKIYRGQAAARAARRASYAQGDVDAGLGEIQKRIAAEQDEAQRKRMDRVAKWMTAGAALTTGAAAVGAGADVILGHSLRKAGFQAQAAGFAGQMYNELTSGDFTSMMALMRDPKAYQAMVSNIRANSQWQQGAEGVGHVGGMVTGGAQTVLGLGMMGSGVGAGIGGMNAVQGLGNLANSTAGLGRTIGNAFAGKTAADTASGALQGLQYLKMLDPIQLRQFQELQARISGIAELGAQSGAGVGAYDAASQINRAGMAGGIGNYGQSEAMFRALRAGTTHAGALEQLRTATESPFSMGIGRDIAIGGLGTTGRMMGGVGGASNQLIEIMRKAMSLGIEDSRLKEAIVTTLPQMLEGSGGRAGALSNVSDMMNLAANNAREQGRGMDLRDLEEAARGVAFGGRLTGGQSASAPLNVAMANATKRAAMQMGLPADTAYAFQLIDNKDLVLNEQTKDLLEEAGVKDPERQKLILKKIREARAGSTGALGVASKKKSVQATAMGKAEGTDYPTAKQGFRSLTTQQEAEMQGYLNDLGKTPEQLMEEALTTKATPTNRVSKETAGAVGAAKTKAGIEGSPMEAALNDPNLKQNLENAVQAASAFVKTLQDYSKVGNLDALRDVPALVDGVAESINRLGDAAANFNGVKRGGATGVPPTVQQKHFK